MMGIGPISGSALTTLGSVVVLEVVPASGLFSGGTSIAIKGLNFSSASAPKIGETSPTGITVSSTTSIACTTAATDSDFIEDVTVVNVAGANECTAHSVFDRVGGASVATLDPNLLVNSGYWYDYPGGGTWNGQTNGGKDACPVYFDRNIFGDAFPTAGTAVNGYTPAIFNGTTQALDTGNKLGPYVYGGDLTDLEVQPRTGFTAFSLVWLDAAAAPAAFEYLDPGIWADSSGYPVIGLSFSTSGAQAVGYDGARAKVTKACSTGAWHLIVVRCSGTQLQLRIDGSEAVTPATFDLGLASDIAGAGQPIAIGKMPYVGSPFQQMRLLCQGFVGRRLSDAECDGVGTYLQTLFALALGFVATSVDPASFSRTSLWLASYAGGARWGGVHRTNNANGNALVTFGVAPGTSTLNALPTATFDGATKAFQATRLTKDMLGTDNGGFLGAVPASNRNRQNALGWTQCWLAKFTTQPVDGGTAYNGAILFTDPQAVVGVGVGSDGGVQAYQIDDLNGINNYVFTTYALLLATATWCLIQARWNGINILEIRIAPDGGTFTAWQQVTCRPPPYPTGNGKPYFGTNYAQAVWLNGEIATGFVSQRVYSTYVLDRTGAYIQNRYARAFGLVTGGAAQNITGVGNVASLEAFGTPKVNMNISAPTSIASAEAFGSPWLNMNVGPAGNITSAEAFGTAKLNENVGPAGNIATAEAFGTPQLNENVGPSGNIVSAEAFGAPRLNENVGPVGNIASAEAFGTPQVNENVGPAGNVASAEAFGSPTVTPGAVTVTPTSITSTEAFGTPQLNENITSPASIASAEAFGTPQVNENVGPAGNILSSEGFGSPQLNLNVTATSIASSEVVSSPTVSPGATTVGPAGNVASSEAFGSPQLNLNLTATSIGSAEAVSSPTVSPGATTVGPSGNILTAEAFGTPQVNENVGPAGNIASAEALGVPQVNENVGPAGNIPTAEAFGALQVNENVGPAGNITSAEAFGTPKLNENVGPAGNVASAEAFGSPTLNENVGPAGNIASAEALGAPALKMNVGPAGNIVTAEVVSSPTVTPGSTTVGPAGNIASAENVPDVIVTSGNAITPFSILSAEAFGTPQLNENVSGAGNIATAAIVPNPQVNENVSGAGNIATAEALGAPTLKLNVQNAGNVPTAEVFGSPQLNQNITPSSVLSAEVFGAPQLNENITNAGGVASAEVLGAPTISAGGSITTAGNIPSAEALGAPALSTVISPTSIASSEVVPSPKLNENVTGVGNVPSEEAFGVPVLAGNVGPAGNVASAEAFGAPRLTENISPFSIASAEAVSSPTVLPGSVTLFPTSVPSAEAVGAPVLSLLIAGAGGITSREAFGTPALALYIVAGGILSEEFVSVPSVILVNQYIIGAGGIVSEEAFGGPLVSLFTRGAVTVLELPGPVGALRPAAAARFVPPSSVLHATPRQTVSAPTGPALPSAGRPTTRRRPPRGR